MFMNMFILITLERAMRYNSKITMWYIDRYGHSPKTVSLHFKKICTKHNKADFSDQLKNTDNDQTSKWETFIEMNVALLWNQHGVPKSLVITYMWHFANLFGTIHQETQAVLGVMPYKSNTFWNTLCYKSNTLKSYALPK